MNVNGQKSDASPGAQKQWIEFTIEVLESLQCDGHPKMGVVYRVVKTIPAGHGYNERCKLAFADGTEVPGLWPVKRTKEAPAPTEVPSSVSQDKVPLLEPSAEISEDIPES